MRRTVLALLLVLVWLPLPNAHAANDAADGNPLRYIVVLDDTDTPGASARRHSDRFNLAPGRIFRAALSGYTATMTDRTASELRRQRGVLSVEPDVEIGLAAQELDPGVDRISRPDVVDTVAIPPLADGTDDLRVEADVAVLDTGVGPHPDLNVVARTDCTLSTSCLDGTGIDGNGHGTHVAGIAAGVDNGFGAVGVAPGARIWSVRVLGANGSGYLSWLIGGIDWVTRHADRVDVANISISCNCVSAAVDAALARSVATGVTYTVAAGNSATDASKFSISNHPDVLTVSALADFDGMSGGVGAPTCRSDVDDTLANFSNWGASVDLVAPGACIRSTYLGGGYVVLSGTSMAAPHAAGAAALLASSPSYRGNPAAIQSRLAADGNGGWTDESADGFAEPLLDVSSIEPVTVATVAPPALTVSDAWVIEGASGTVATFTVETDRPLQGGETITATAVTNGGTAVSGVDFTALAKTVLRFTPGSESLTLEVPISADAVPEGNEAFYLDLSAPLGATIGDTRGTGTIVDAGGPLSLSVSDVTVAEPAGAGSAAAAAVRLSAPVPPGHRVTAKISTANGTATAAKDYQAPPTQTLVFDPGDQEKTFMVELLPDQENEVDETFSVKASSVTGAAVADGVGTVSVLDDEGPIQIAVSNAWTAEGNSGDAEVATFAVQLSSPPADGQSVAITVATADGTAKAGVDYTRLSPRRLTFLAGVSEQLVSVAVTGDGVVEGNETFRLLLSGPSGGLLVDSEGTGTIATDDGVTAAAAPRAISVSDARITESWFGSSVGTVELRLSSAPGPGESASVTVSSADVTATTNSDYSPVPPATIVFGPGESSRTVAVGALDDGLAEPTETFTVKLSAAAGAVLADSQATVMVVSDEGPISAAFGDGWLIEDDAGTAEVHIPVRLSGAPDSGQSVSVVVATADSTAKAGSDYVRLSPIRVTFAPGEVEKLVSLQVLGDLLREGSESLALTLSSPLGMTIADSQGTVTIADDEGPITAAAADTRVEEGAAGTATSLVYTVRLTAAPAAGQSFKVTVKTVAGGSATTPGDYQALASTVLTFATGETDKAVAVPISGDDVVELDETVHLSLSSTLGGLIADPTGVGTLLNDD